MKSSFVFLLCFGAIFAGHVPESRYNHQYSKELRLRHFVLADEVDEVLKLLKSGASSVVRYLDGHSPIHLAALMGYPRTTEILADHHADCNAINAEGLTPLFIAVQHGRDGVVDVLLSKGADADFQETKSGKTALHIASELGLTSIVKSLIKSHANVNIKDKAGNSPLDIAVEKNDKTIAALLIASSSNTNAGGWKSAVIACIARNINSKTNETLVKRGAESDESWIISLKDAIVEGDLKGATMLVKYCVDDLKNVQSPWPVHTAAYKGNVAILKMLLENGGNLNSKDEFGNTPLHWTAFSGKTNTAKFLIEHGAEVNSKNLKDFTPLHLAAREDKPDITRLLIENGADFHAKSKKGNTPLHSAAYYGYSDVVQILLDSNVDVDVKNNAGLTALDLARSNGKNEIVELLKAEKQDSNDE